MTCSFISSINKPFFFSITNNNKQDIYIRTWNKKLKYESVFWWNHSFLIDLKTIEQILWKYRILVCQSLRYVSLVVIYWLLFIFVLIEYESKGNWGWIKKKRLFSNLNLMFFFVFFNIFLLIFFGQFR